LVEGDNRYLRNVVGEENNIGIWLVGDMNTFHGGEARSNTAQGVRVDGDLNTVIENLVVLNGDHGIQVTGDYNTMSKNRVGDLRQSNGGDGIHLEGAGNLLQGNTIFLNGGDGLEVSGGISAPALNVNVLKGNTIGDKGKGNSRYGIYLHGDVGNGGVNPVELEGNIVKASGLHGIFLDTGATAHQLKNNRSGGGSGLDNGDCEFYVAAGNLNATGNKANDQSIAGSNNSPFPTGCIGTP